MADEKNTTPIDVLVRNSTLSRKKRTIPVVRLSTERYGKIIKERFDELTQSFGGSRKFIKYLKTIFNSADTLFYRWHQAGGVIPGDSAIRLASALEHDKHSNKLYYDPYYLRPDLKDIDCIRENINSEIPHDK